MAHGDFSRGLRDAELRALWPGHTYAQIAEAMRCTVKTVMLRGREIGLPAKLTPQRLSRIANEAAGTTNNIRIAQQARVIAAAEEKRMHMIGMQRRCQAQGCGAVFRLEDADDLVCPDCEAAGKRVAPGGRSAIGNAAAMCVAD